MISQAAWRKYIGKLAAIDKKAADQMRAWVDKNGLTDDDALIRYAYGLATKYGEASATLSCEMYDAMSGMMKAGVPDALPAETATYEEVAKGVMWGKYHSPSQIPSIVGRQVRLAGADTMMKNAGRDQAEWAWVPQGDTCAFCITLASNGWQKASSAVLRGGHADHIHQNCDCTFAISFKEKDKKQYDYIYDPQKYKDMYYGADGDTPNERMNYIRRQIYDRNKDEINAQKRDAYQAKNLEEQNKGNTESNTLLASPITLVESSDQMGKPYTETISAKGGNTQFRVYQSDRYPYISCQTYSKNSREMCSIIDSTISRREHKIPIDKVVIAKYASLGGISAFDHKNNKLYIAEELCDPETFKRLVDYGYFPARSVEDVLEHELEGHQRHWDAVQRYYETHSGRYSSLEEAKNDLEESLRKYVKTMLLSDPDYISKTVSENAYIGYNKTGLNELIADVRVLLRQGKITDDRLFELVNEVLFYDG